MNLDVRAALAVERGLDFLAKRQLPYGEFPSVVAAQPDLQTRYAPDTNHFTTPQVMWSLRFVEHRRASSLIRRAAGFLVSGRGPDGLWRFFTTRVRRHVDPDVDVTACAAAVLSTGRVCRPRQWLETSAGLLSALDELGRFRTWIRESPCNDVDSVANANVLWFLGDDPRGARAAAWLAGLLESKQESGSYPYYESPLALYHAVSRALFAGAAQLACVRPVLVARVLERALIDGSFGTAVETAFAMCALHNLGVSRHSAMTGAAAVLLRQQRRDGSWPRFAVWNGPEWPAPRSLWWGSECWTTALAMEALARLRSLVKVERRTRAARRGW